MRRDERYPYWLLADLEEDVAAAGVSLTTSLCAWCRYSRWSGSCQDCNLKCTHPLSLGHDKWDPCEVWLGSDCWGFRPLYPQEACVDAVGIMLQGKYPDMSTIPLLEKKK